jgi:hypothetical protein
MNIRSFQCDAKAVLHSLLLSTKRSSGTPASQEPVVNRQQPGTDSSTLILSLRGGTNASLDSTDLSVDGGWPPIPRSEAKFETPKEQEQGCATHFSGPMVALREFSAAYNSVHVIDVQKVRALRKAWGIGRIGIVASGEPKVKMEIAKISNEGLCVTAILVAALWCLVVANHRILHRSAAEASQVLLELRHLRRQNAAHWETPEKPPHRPVASASRASSIPI